MLEPIRLKLLSGSRLRAAVKLNSNGAHAALSSFEGKLSPQMLRQAWTCERLEGRKCSRRSERHSDILSYRFDVPWPGYTTPGERSIGVFMETSANPHVRTLPQGQERNRNWPEVIS
jgi:hypothetical protein